MAAGLGFKTFAVGEVLTAADTNGYLMQGVLVFASAAARDAAITSPQEGQFAYLKDTNVTTYYTGSAWANLDTTGMVNPMTTTGDTIYSSSGSTPARLGIGSNGQVLSVSGGLPAWTTLGGSSSINKNYCINGGFAVAQRGTSFTSTGSKNNNDTYNLDRFYVLSDGNNVVNITQDTSTIPTNGQYSLAQTVVTANKKFGSATIIENRDCLELVGNAATFSFKAKVSSITRLSNVKAAIVAWTGTADTVTSDIISAWGAAGTNPTLIANAAFVNTPANLNLTTSFATYSVTGSIPSNTTNIILFVWSDVTTTTATTDVLYVAQAKLELGSTATSFTYAGGSFEGELAACQRYLFYPDASDYFTGFNNSTTQGRGAPLYKVTMRTAPTATYGLWGITIKGSAGFSTTSVQNGGTTVNGAVTLCNVSSGLTAGEGCYIYPQDANSNWSAEL